MMKRKGGLEIFGMIVIGIIMIAHVALIHAYPEFQKLSKVNREANVFITVTDDTSGILPLLSVKTRDYSYLDIFSCMSGGSGECHNDDTKMDLNARGFDSRIILYKKTGESVTYGEEKTGDTLYVDMPIPGGKKTHMGIVLRALVTEGGMMDSGRNNKYGSCKREGNAEYIRNHLTEIDFMGLDVNVHSIAKDDFLAVVEDIKKCEEGRNYDFWRPDDGAKYGGTYNCRYNENDPTRMSMHAYGLAIDINPLANPNCPKDEQCNGENEPITDIPQCVIDAFRDNNFRWGGDFITVKDTMHFEWVNPDERSFEDVIKNSAEQKYGDEMS